MKNLVIAIVVVFGLVIGSCGNKREGEPKVLIFFKTMGYKHASILTGIAALKNWVWKTAPFHICLARKKLF